MDINRTSDVAGGVRSSVTVPSGFEVESARLHMPSDGGQHTSGMTLSRWSEALDTVKSRSLSKLSSARESMASGISGVKPAAQRHVATMRSGVRGTMMKAQNNLRTNPARWAGAAMGAGFTVGILGRLMLHRAQHRSMPEVIVLSSAC